jgi:phage-related tail fiber protein
MELKDIFELIVKADEKLKYATAAKADTRSEQARALLERARAEAAAAGSDSLVQQASQRLSDLDALQAGGEE